jgi:hypothetical protein
MFRRGLPHSGTGAWLAQRFNIDLLNKIQNPALLRSGTGVQVPRRVGMKQVTQETMPSKIKSPLQKNTSKIKSIISHS